MCVVVRCLSFVVCCLLPVDWLLSVVVCCGLCVVCCFLLFEVRCSLFEVRLLFVHCLWLVV